MGILYDELKGGGMNRPERQISIHHRIEFWQREARRVRRVCQTVKMSLGEVSPNWGSCDAFRIEKNAKSSTKRNRQR